MAPPFRVSPLWSFFGFVRLTALSLKSKEVGMKQGYLPRFGRSVPFKAGFEPEPVDVVQTNECEFVV